MNCFSIATYTYQVVHCYPDSKTRVPKTCYSYGTKFCGVKARD